MIWGLSELLNFLSLGICEIFILHTCSTAGVEVKKACEFLLSHQMEDGGWGEEFAVSFLLLVHEAREYHICTMCSIGIVL